MKKIIPALVLLFIAAIVGCKKDSQPAIMGKWILTKTQYSYLNNVAQSVYDSTSVDNTGKYYIQFNQNGSGTTNMVEQVYSSISGRYTSLIGNFNYKIDGENLVCTFPTEFSRTMVLNSNQGLVLTQKISEIYLDSRGQAITRTVVRAETFSR